MGVLVPIVDFIKLIMKNRIVAMNNILILSICLKILVSLILLRFCKYYNFMGSNHIMIYLMVVSRLIGYAIILPGLTTKRVYGVIGMIRMFAMILRFEIRLFLLIVVINYLNIGDQTIITIFLLPIISLLCIIIFTIEINRHPFEIIEGESELVSGFNVELRSLVFIVFFLSEIINITVIVIIICYIYHSLILYLPIIILILLLRSRYPRIRYDIIIILQ